MVSRLAWRRLSVALLALSLTGCTSLVTQTREEALISVGSEQRLEPAADYADLFVDYALLSDQSYADSLYDSSKPIDVGDKTYCVERTSDGEPCADARQLTPYARQRLGRWRRIYAEKHFERFGCPKGRTECISPLGGLGVQIWVRRGRTCSDAVIAFRGTDGGSADDWITNLRWALRLAPVYDQYDQVQDYTPGLVDLIRQDRCFREGRTRIVAIGHSLGGGLAEQAAYRDGGVVHAYTFDPSVVTGFFDLPDSLRDANKRGLQIERVYERGEVLAYPRWALAQIAPVSACNPEIRTIRLFTITGSPIARHSLNSMTTALLDWSKARHEAGLPADRALPGTSCPNKDGAGLVTARSARSAQTRG